jgi:hypothetical protein
VTAVSNRGRAAAGHRERHGRSCAGTALDDSALDDSGAEPIGDHTSPPPLRDAARALPATRPDPAAALGKAQPKPGHARRQQRTTYRAFGAAGEHFKVVRLFLLAATAIR